MSHAHPPRIIPTHGCAFVARVAFDYNQRHFEPGDSFPYAELGLTEDFALNWWRAAMLEVAPVDAPKAIDPDPAPATPPPKQRAKR